MTACLVGRSEVDSRAAGAASGVEAAWRWGKGEAAATAPESSAERVELGLSLRSLAARLMEAGHKDQALVLLYRAKRLLAH